MNRPARAEPRAVDRRAGWIKRPHHHPSPDTELVTAAITAIECLTTIPLETIRVTSSNRWLHLEGTVSQSHQRVTLEEVTRNLPGVRGVTDCVTVSPGSA